jgi:Ca-activated chloride channel family protein
VRFADPQYLLLLPVAAAYAWLHWPRRDRPPVAHVSFPGMTLLSGMRPSARERAASVPVALRTACLCLFVLALARPQAGDVRDTTIRGRNVVIALDISSSMKAEDFGPGNRLDVAKRVVGDFIDRRHGDLLGLVVFAGTAFTQVPLTVDTGIVREMLGRVNLGMLPDGTAIGTALATSLTHVESLPKSSVVVLITDGVNNRGLDPMAAAEAARALGIRVYTIGVSTQGRAVYTGQSFRPAPAPWRQDDLMKGRRYGAVPTTVDEEMLGRMAEITGGRYYRAADPQALSSVLGQIDRLERNKIRVRRVANMDEAFAVALMPALAFLVLEIALGTTWLRKLP